MQMSPPSLISLIHLNPFCMHPIQKEGKGRGGGKGSIQKRGRGKGRDRSSDVSSSLFQSLSLSSIAGVEEGGKKKNPKKKKRGGGCRFITLAPASSRS